MRSWFAGWRRGAPFALMVMTLAYGTFGVTLILQPDRWGNTPAYANLLDILPQQVWGLVYLVVALMMGLAVWCYDNRLLAVIAHTLAIALTGAWLLAFIIRYATDDGTTIVNVVNWSVYLVLAIQSALRLDDRPPLGALR